MNPEDAREAIEAQTNDEHSELANDVDRSIEVLFNQIELDGSSNPTPIDPSMALSILRPMIRQKADTEPATVLKTLAVIHLESGALLEQHTEKDPADLV